MKLDNTIGMVGSPWKQNELGICPPPCYHCLTPQFDLLPAEVTCNFFQNLQKNDEDVIIPDRWQCRFSAHSTAWGQGQFPSLLQLIPEVLNKPFVMQYEGNNTWSSRFIPVGQRTIVAEQYDAAGAVLQGTLTISRSIEVAVVFNACSSQGRYVTFSIPHQTITKDYANLPPRGFGNYHPIQIFEQSWGEDIGLNGYVKGIIPIEVYASLNKNNWNYFPAQHSPFRYWFGATSRNLPTFAHQGTVQFNGSDAGRTEFDAVVPNTTIFSAPTNPAPIRGDDPQDYGWVEIEIDNGN